MYGDDLNISISAGKLHPKEINMMISKNIIVYLWTELLV